MKINTFKVRGYEGIRHLEFEKSDIPKLVELIGEDGLIQAVNTAKISHEWNSNFENALCELAEKAGNVRAVVKDAEGKITDRETNATFLKRTKFVLDAKAAQELADSVVFPPVASTRSPKVDKEAVERLQLAQMLFNDASKLENYRKKVEFGNTLSTMKVQWPNLNGETTEEEDISAIAEVIRQYRLQN